MIDLHETLPGVEAEIAAFEAEVAKLKEFEKNQAALQAELATSKARESEILSDHTSDAKSVAKKLAEQRAFSDTISSRMADIEAAWKRAYDVGGQAARSLHMAADEFRCRFEFSRRPLFDHRPNATYRTFSPTMATDRQTSIIHQSVSEWSTTLRKHFERLTEDHKIYAVLRKETLAAAMGFSGQPDNLTKPLPHAKEAVR